MRLSMGALLRWGALLLLIPIAAQQPAPPRFYAYDLLPGDKAWTWQPITVDPPLTLTRDAAGVAHLGITQITFVDGEVPGGAIDGKNVAFTLAATPTGLALHLDGLLLGKGDYALNGSLVMMALPPPVGSKLLASYRR